MEAHLRSAMILEAFPKKRVNEILMTIQKLKTEEQRPERTGKKKEKKR